MSQKITALANAGVTEKDISAMLKRKCRAYLSKGPIGTEFDNLNKTTLADLYTTGPYNFLGDLAEDAGQFSTEQEETKTLFFVVPGAHTGTLTLTLTNVVNLLGVIDSDEVKENVVNVLLIPDGTDDEYIVFKEMTMGSDVTMEVTGKPSLVNFKFFKTAEKIGDIVAVEKNVPAA